MTIVTIIDEKQVYPASTHHPSCTWTLSVNDIVMPPVNIRWITFYESDGSKDFMSSEKLEGSLARVLDYYPLLAGRMVALPQGGFQIEYNKDDILGCTFLRATANFSLTDIQQSGFARTQIPDALKPGTPFSVPKNSLFAVQTTRLTCGSVVMSYSMPHNIGDGHSIYNFVEKWSRVCRNQDIEKPLLEYASVLRPDSSPVVEPPLAFKIKTSDGSSNPPPSSVIQPASRVVLTFEADKVALLKSIANADLKSGSWVSTNDCLTTLVWRALTRARGLKEGEMTVCGVAGDGRKKWHTQLGDMSQYFGNLLVFPTASSDAGALLKCSLGEAALLIRDQVQKIDLANIQSLINWIDRVDNKASIIPNYNTEKGMFITSWATFPLYDSDFGWGNPIKVVHHTPGINGLAYVLPRGCIKDADRNGLEVIFGVQSANLDKILIDEELLQFASLIVD